MARRLFARVGVAALALGLIGTPAARAADPSAEDEPPDVEIGGDRWPFSLRFWWDDGLLYEAGSPLHRPEWLPDELWLRKEDVIVRGRAGFRLHLDAAAFVSSGDAPDIDPKADGANGDVVRVHLGMVYSIFD